MPTALRLDRPTVSSRRFHQNRNSWFPGLSSAFHLSMNRWDQSRPKLWASFGCPSIEPHQTLARLASNSHWCVTFHKFAARNPQIAKQWETCRLPGPLDAQKPWTHPTCYEHGNFAIPKASRGAMRTAPIESIASEPKSTSTILRQPPCKLWANASSTCLDNGWMSTWYHVLAQPLSKHLHWLTKGQGHHIWPIFPKIVVEAVARLETAPWNASILVSSQPIRTWAFSNSIPTKDASWKVVFMDFHSIPLSPCGVFLPVFWHQPSLEIYHCRIFRRSWAQVSAVNISEFVAQHYQDQPSVSRFPWLLILSSYHHHHHHHHHEAKPSKTMDMGWLQESDPSLAQASATAPELTCSQFYKSSFKTTGLLPHRFLVSEIPVEEGIEFLRLIHLKALGNDKRQDLAGHFPPGTLQHGIIGSTSKFQLTTSPHSDVCVWLFSLIMQSFPSTTTIETIWPNEAMLFIRSIVMSQSQPQSGMESINIYTHIYMLQVANGRC